MPEPVALSKYGLGAAPLGNLFHQVSDEDARATLLQAASYGIVHIDTAPLYGHGLSEQRIGKALAVCEDTRFKITTKVGRCLDHGRPRQSDFASPLSLVPRFDYSRDGILRSFDDSCSRLGTDKLHALLLHDIGERTHGVDHRKVLGQAVDEALPAMQDLKASGQVETIGLGVNEWEVCEEVMRVADLDHILLAGRYTLLEQGALQFLDRCVDKNVGVVIGGVFNSGLLAGSETYDYAVASDAMIGRRDDLSKICRNFGIPLAAVALQFAAAHPAVIRTVVGLRSSAEVDALVANIGLNIPSELWQELKRDGHIDEAAPTPC